MSTFSASIGGLVSTINLLIHYSKFMNVGNGLLLKKIPFKYVKLKTLPTPIFESFKDFSMVNRGHSGIFD